MSNYVPWHGKKRAGLADREDKLLRVLRRGGPSGRITRAAEEVRAARIRMFRAEWSRIDRGDGTHTDRMAFLDGQIRQASSEPVEAIIEACRRKILAPRSDQ